MDLMDPSVVDHQRRVAYITLKLGQTLGLPRPQVETAMLAAMLHDCGIFSQQDKHGALRFDFDGELAVGHALIGANLVDKLQTHLFDGQNPELAQVVRYHHHPWDHGRGAQDRGRAVPLAAHLVHLADRLDVLLDHGQDPLAQAPQVTDMVLGGKHRLFEPQVTEALAELASHEFFWLDQCSPQALQQVLAAETSFAQVDLDLGRLTGLAEVFGTLVDFKSSFTAAHSAGVACVAVWLARAAGWPQERQDFIKVAGLLHDLGKLAVPNEILDKPGPLEAQERNIIKRHPFYTFRLLGTNLGWHTLAAWGAFHHERLDGTGYPFGHQAQAIDQGSRIIAVADVFTALAEDRPYRQAMPLEKILAILEDMVAKAALERDLVDLLRRDARELLAELRQTQEARRRSYQELKALAA